MYCGALPGGGVFFFFFSPHPHPPLFLPVRNVTGSIKLAENYLSLTLCLPRKSERGKKKSYSDIHEAVEAQRGFNTQRSTAGLGLSTAKRNYLLGCRQVSVSSFFFLFLRSSMLRVNDFFSCLQRRYIRSKPSCR